MAADIAEIIGKLHFHGCVAAVKWLRKERVCPESLEWTQYIKAQKFTNTSKDPAKHSAQTLKEYLEAIAKHVTEENKAAAQSTVLQQYLGWLMNKQQDYLQHSHSNGGKRKRSELEGEQEEPVWQLVKRTAQHHSFITLYNLPSYKDHWHQTPRTGSDRSKRPRLLAVDCEMCCTADDERALVKVCVVDEQGEVVLKTIVKPDGEVLDYKTDVTGVDAAALQGVYPSRAHVCQFLSSLLGPNVVLIGHSLHNDLASLHLDHAPVIDTALLFSYRGHVDHKPSLAALAKQVLRQDIRQGTSGQHDPCEDARTAMRLVVHQLNTQGDLELEPPHAKVEKEELRKLLAHRIPEGTTVQDLLSLFATHPGCPQPLSVEPDDGSGVIRGKKVQLVFKHPGEADDAFKALPGMKEQDSAGRYTKQAKLSNGSEVSVRKNGCHNGLAFSRIKGQSQAIKVNGAAAKKKKKKKKKVHKQERRMPAAEEKPSAGG